MKHALKSRASAWATTLVATALLMGCSKEKKETPPSEPLPKGEVTLYTEGKAALSVMSSLSYILDPEGKFASSTPMFDIDVGLSPYNNVVNEIKMIYGEVNVIKVAFTPKDIKAIDVIALSDYDAAHPKGSSLNDILELHYIGEDGQYYSVMDLTEYFATHPVLNWDSRKSSGWLFRLAARTPPSKENELSYRPAYLTDKDNYFWPYFGVTVKITMEDGTTLSIAPIPGQKI